MSKPAIKNAIIVVLVSVAAVVFYRALPQESASELLLDTTPLAMNSLPAATTEPLATSSALKPKTTKNSVLAELQGTSLAGTDIDRSLLQVVDDKLVLNGGLLFYFDYFLSLEGEMSLPEIQQLLLQDVQANYSEAVARQIMDLFRRYVDYLAEVGRREASVTHEQVIAQHLSAKEMQNSVRHLYFSPEEIAALFDGYDAMLAKPAQASVRQKTYEQYQQAIAQNPGQLESVATELYGAAAAQNLQNVQYQRQQWAGRVAHYEREKQSIRMSYANDIQGQQQALALLQQRLFSDTERRRVQALERIASGAK